VRQSCTVGGTAVILAFTPWQAAIGGTVVATTTQTPDPAIDGSVTVTNSVATAFLNPTLGGVTSDRVVGARVLIEGEEMTGLTGQVVIREELDNPIVTAEFELSDPRVARYSGTTLSWGDSACQIYLRSGPPGASVEWLAFEGTITAPANTGNTRPQGRFQAVGAASAWANNPVCITGAAFEGKRRGEIIRLAIESAGGALVTSIDDLGAEVQRPYELMGILPAEALVRICEPEGWHFRVDAAGDVEVIDADELLEGPALIDLTESNYDTCEEEPPQSPITKWVFSGTILATDGTDEDAAQLQAGQRTVRLPIQYDADGSYTEVELVMDKSTELFRRQITHRVQATDGYPAAGPAVLQPVSKIEIESRYPRIDSSSGDYNYSTRLDWRKTKRWELTGTRCSTDTGYLWASGQQYVEVSARLTLVEEIEETYEYNTDPSNCTIKTVTFVRNQLFAPRCDPALGGAHIYVDEEAAGGISASLSQSQTLRETMRSVQHWNDYRNPNVGSVPTVLASKTVTRWIPNAFAASPYETSLIDSYIPAELVRDEWVGDASQTKWKHTTTTTFPPGVVKTLDGALPPPGQRTEEGTGPVPGPPSGNAFIPQFSQQVFVWTVDRSDIYPFEPVQRTETLEQVESTAEAEIVGERRIARAVSTVERITCQTIPLLRVGDKVTLVNNARNITTAKEGYVLSIERAHGVVDATARQQMNVLIPYEAS